MEATVSDNGIEPANRAVAVRDALVMITSPRSVFARVEDTGAYGWMLATMLGLLMLMGYLQIQSGLIDYLVDEQTEKSKGVIESGQANLVDRAALKESFESADQQGEFMKTITKWSVVVVSPLNALASFLLIAAVLYAVVALTGRKPEWHSLMSICVYAGVLDLAAHGLRLAMLFYYRTLDVDTSLRSLGPAGEPTFLAAIDPFRIWFWVLVGLGLVVTQQLSRRMAIVSCSLMCLAATGARAAMEYVPK